MQAQDWLHIGMWGMLIGTAVIGYIGYTMRQEDRHHVWLAGWITLIAATAYYAMSVKLGNFTVNGETLQLARYVDWVVTTPLLLVSLLAVGLPANKSKKRFSLMAGVIGLDVYMILTGVFATLTTDKWPWYVFSCVALVLIAYMLYVVVFGETKAVAGKKVTNVYQNLALYLSVLWLAYPIVWYLAGSGKGTISFDTENAVYAVLDLLAKVGFGIFLLLSVKGLAAGARPKAGESTVEAAVDK